MTVTKTERHYKPGPQSKTLDWKLLISIVLNTFNSISTGSVCTNHLLNTYLGIIVCVHPCYKALLFSENADYTKNRDTSSEIFCVPDFVGWNYQRHYLIAEVIQCWVSGCKLVKRQSQKQSRTIHWKETVTSLLCCLSLICFIQLRMSGLCKISIVKNVLPE